MDRRVFLGCDRPFVGAVVDWLWARRDELPGMVVVVPTAQGGRRLRDEDLIRTPEDVERSESRNHQRDQQRGRPPVERRGAETLARLVAERQTFLG